MGDNGSGVVPVRNTQTLLDSSSGDPQEPPKRPSRPMQGTAIDRYVVLYELGSGGMGVVYAAYDPELDRKVALKILHPDRGSTNAQTRLLREAKAIAQLSHPSVVTVHDVGTYEGRIFVAMEFIDGVTFRRWTHQTQRPWREVVAIMMRAGEGLAAAHAADLVHRDFKPDNVMVQSDGRVVVLDFGLVRRVQSRSGSAAPPAEPTADPPDQEDKLGEKLTRGGAKLGTPAYMAPEQQLGQPTDARADQFAFCVVMWEAIYGVRPFEGGNAAATGMHIILGEIREPPKGMNVPAWLRRVLLRGLSTDPDRRYPSMRALLADLSRDRVRGWRRWSVAGAGVLLAVGLGQFLRGGTDDRCAGGRDEWARTWDELRRAEIDRVFAQTSVPYASVAAQGVARVLDGYGDEWIASYRAACEATHVHREQSTQTHEQRIACLQSRKTMVQALVDELTRADAAVVEHAIEAVNGLPRVSDCSDVEALALGAPAPYNLATGERVKALRVELADAHAKEAAGRYEPALALAETVATQAIEIGYQPLRAEAQLVRGAILERKGDFVGAESSLLDAILAAKASGHDRIEAEAWLRLVWITGVERMLTEQGHGWGRFAEAAIERIGGTSELRAELEHNLAGVLYREGQLDEALVRYRRALAEQERLLGADDPRIAMTLNHIGNVLMEQGQLEMSREFCERSLAERKRILGDRHPRVAASLNNLAELSRKQGDHEEALRLAQQSLEIAAATGTQEEIIALVIASDALGQLQQHADAIAPLERLVQIRELATDPSGEQLATALRRLAQAHHRAGAPEPAIVAYERALARADAKPTVGAIEAFIGLAAARADLGRTASARAALAQAQAAAEALPLTDPPLLAELAAQRERLYNR